MVLCGLMNAMYSRQTRQGRKKGRKEKNEHDCLGPQDWALTLCMQQPLNRDLYRTGQEEGAGQLVIGSGSGSDIDNDHDERPRMQMRSEARSGRSA